MRLVPVVLVLTMLVTACSTQDESANSPETIGETSPIPDPTATRVESGPALPEPTPSPVAATPTVPFLVGAEPEIAWSAAESTRDIANYLEALRQGAFEQAAWPAHGNGIVFEDQASGETGAEFLARMCGNDRCAGPYLIQGGPGYVAAATAQGFAPVSVEHLVTGDRSVMTLSTFEGQRFIASLPPMVTSENTASLRESLFDDSQPRHVVIERFDAFEIWDGASTDWVTNWHASEALQVDGDLVATWSGVYSLRDPAQEIAGGCTRVIERDGRLLGIERCQPDVWNARDLVSGEAVIMPIEPADLGDGNLRWFTERGGAILVGIRDAEGNLGELETIDGVDLLHDDYGGLVQLSADGSLVAYVDHRDPAATSHFWSPVVVVRSISTGKEVGRWQLEGPVICLEFAVDWIIACEADDATIAGGDPDQRALASINVVSGDVNRVQTGTRVFLPTLASS